MPKGTRVARCVEKLEGKPGINKYAVCQASTGQGYATGKPIRKKLLTPQVKESRLKDIYL